MRNDRIGADFAAELARLKRRGSAVLVRGDGHDLGLCTDLLGSDEERRLRLLVRSADSGVLPVPPAGADIVEVTRGDVRSSVRNRSDAFDDEAVVRRVDGEDDVEAVTAAVGEEVERIAADGLDPGEIRVCLGRLDRYLGTQDERRVVEAVEDVTDRVRAHSGMCHAHLAVEPSGALERSFDVSVEARTTTSGQHQHRWHLHAAGIDTGWLRRGTR